MLTSKVSSYEKCQSVMVVTTEMPTKENGPDRCGFRGRPLLVN